VKKRLSHGHPMYKHMSPLIGFVCHLKYLFLGFEQVKMCVYRWVRDPGVWMNIYQFVWLILR